MIRSEVGMVKFNSVCYVTQQTIVDQDRVVLFPILQAKNLTPVELEISIRNETRRSKQLSYPGGAEPAWLPFGPLIKGTFNGDRRITPDPDAANLKALRSFFTMIRENIAHASRGSGLELSEARSFSDRYDPAREVSPEQLFRIWWDILSLEETGRLFFFSEAISFRRLSLAIMHEAAFSKLTALALQRAASSGYPGTTYELCRDFLAERWQRGQETITGLSAKRALGIEASRKLLTQALCDYRSFMISNHAKISLNPHYADHMGDIVRHMSAVSPATEDVSEEIASLLFRDGHSDVIEHILLMNALGYFRHHPAPISYSQAFADPSRDAQMADLISAVSAEIYLARQTPGLMAEEESTRGPESP